MIQFQLAAEPHSTDVAKIADMPPLPDISYAQYDAEYESDELSDLGGAEGKASISLKQVEFSLKQFAKRMVQPNFSTLNKRKKVWVAGFLEKKLRSSIRGQNPLKQPQDGPLSSEIGVADILETFATWLLLENFGNTEWIWWRWGEMFLKKCGSDIRKARQLATGN